MSMLNNKASLVIAPEENLELQNPREESSFEDYYKNLDVEKNLEMIQFNDNNIYSAILNNSKGLNHYLNKQERVDLIRSSRIKIPNFRKREDPLTNVSNKFSRIKESSKISSNQLEKLGFFNINPNTTTKELPYEYFRPDLIKDALVRGKSMNDMKQFQVHYDMDETDLLFLNWLNENSSSTTEQISMEHFEIIITFFETKLYQIEKILPPTIKDRSTIDYQQQQNAILYGSDDGVGCNSQEEQACAVCGLSNSDNLNSIVFCDGCDIAVHQDCYGVSFIPEGPWLCRRCLIARNSVEKCLFCPSTTGAFKQTDSGDWAHVGCTLWIPELYFANPIYMEPIEGVDSIPKSRWKLICYICKQKVGACIQCSKPTCFNAYHVTCAKRSGLYMKMKKGVKAACNDKSTLASYCDKHTPIEWGTTHDVKSGISKARLYFHDREKHIIDHAMNNNELVSITQQEYNELVKTKSEDFKWRLKSNIYAIPEFLINQLINFNTDNKLPGISKAALYQISKYYTLKKDNLGKPLIKKPDVFNYACLNENEINSRNNSLRFFQTDVMKLLEISKLTEKRCKLEKRLTEAKLEAATVLLEPFKWIYNNLVSFFKAQSLTDFESLKIPKNSAKPTIVQIFSKIADNEYKSLDTLINDIEHFGSWIMGLNLTNNGNKSLLELQKTFRAWQRYKKKKYDNAKEYFVLFSDKENWSKFTSKFLLDKQLNLSFNNEVSGENKVNIAATSLKGKKKKNINRKFGIELNVTDHPLPIRNLRNRTATANIVSKPEVKNNSKHLKARLNRVRLRSSAVKKNSEK